MTDSFPWTWPKVSFELSKEVYTNPLNPTGILPLLYNWFLVPKKEASAEGVVVPEGLQWVGTEVDFNSHFVS